MSPEFDKKLCERFPQLYRDRHASMQKTAMCWGFPGDGWFNILWMLSLAIEDEVKMSGNPEVVATQVKEKFGALRFYIDSGNSRIYDLIMLAERLSETTCEDCGAYGKTRGGGWIRTLCDKCVGEVPSDVAQV